MLVVPRPGSNVVRSLGRRRDGREALTPSAAAERTTRPLVSGRPHTSVADGSGRTGPGAGSGGAADVLLHLAVADVNHAMRVGRDVGLVRDEHDGVAARVQPFEHTHDFSA